MDQDKVWHAMDTGEVFDGLGTTPEGLTEDEAEERLARYGPNAIEPDKGPSVLGLLFDQLKNPLVIVLVAVAAISLLAGKAVDAIVVTKPQVAAARPTETKPDTGEAQ